MIRRAKKGAVAYGLQGGCGRAETIDETGYSPYPGHSSNNHLILEGIARTLEPKSLMQVEATSPQTPKAVI